MKLVIIESPFGINPNAMIPYARACVADSIGRGEAPIASHLLLTQPGILDDRITEEREKGIAAGIEWYKVADLCAVYTDHEISRGMNQAITLANHRKIPIDYRRLDPEGPYMSAKEDATPNHGVFGAPTDEDYESEWKTRLLEDREQTEYDAAQALKRHAAMIEATQDNVRGARAIEEAAKLLEDGDL